MKINLKAFRRNKKISQSEMAKYLNVVTDTYRNYETGRTEPTLDTLIKIADILDVSIDELLGRERNVISESDYETLSFVIGKYRKTIK